MRGFNTEQVIKHPPAYTRPGIPVNRSHIPSSETARKWSHLQHIADEMSPILDVEVGILISYDCTEALNPINNIRSTEGAPFVQESILGWGIIGGSDTSRSTNRSTTCYRTNSIIMRQTKTVDQTPEDMSLLLMKELGGLESDDCKVSMEDRSFLDQLHNGIHKTDNGHYELPLPLKTRDIAMPDNRELAEKRLNHLKKRLLRDRSYHTDYTRFMDETISQGHAEIAPTEYEPGRLNYIPHHGVYHPKKPNKIRVVFDCSAKWKGVCLNDVLLQGPDQLNALLGVIHRFRKNPIAICCDIEKMFHAFYVDDDCRDLLRFLWWQDGNMNTEPKEYRMRVHLFGATSSPGCATFALKQAANDGRDTYGDAAAQFVERDFYMDDGITSVSSDEEAIQLIQGTTAMCQDAGIHLHKFVSNSAEVMKSIPETERAKNLANIDLSQVERVLGIE